MSELPDPNSGLNMSSAIIAFVIGAWGGLIAFLQRVREGKAKFSWADFLIEVSISMFAGFVVWHFAIWLTVPESGAGAFAGLAGHQGARTFFIIKAIVIDRAKRYSDE